MRPAAPLFLLLVLGVSCGSGDDGLTRAESPQGPVAAVLPTWSEEADGDVDKALASAETEDCGAYRWARHPKRTFELLVQCRSAAGEQWDVEYLIAQNWYQNTFRVFEQPLGRGFP